ncbi:MAG: DUF4412 domain-containing protein [Verrucomicrobiota bacterium]
MKNLLRAFLPGIVCLNLAAFAQPGPPRGPQFTGAMDKLFGENQSFSATLEMQTADTSGGTMTMPGKIMFDSGKSRFEMDMTQAKGGQMPPDAAAQMKAMGMDRTVMIGRPDKKVAYMIFPGMKSYVENALSDSETTTATSDFKVETTELGKDTVDGHPCVKNKVIVTGKDGTPHESTVWNATDLKNFPVKIQTTEQGHKMTMLYKDITLSKPDASVFEPPSDYTKYDSIQGMMQAFMMKQMGGGGLPFGR